MIQFQTQVEYYENKIPVNIQIFITRGLFSLTTTSELSDIRANLSLKLPVILKKKSIAYSKLKIRISSDLPPRLVKYIDAHMLESPIASAICDSLTGKDSLRSYYNPSHLKLNNDSHEKAPISFIKNSKHNLDFAVTTINLLQVQKISAIYFVDTQDLGLSISLEYKDRYSPKIFIFNLYKNPEIINSLSVFLPHFLNIDQKLIFIGLENLPKTKQETLFQLIKNNIKNCIFFIKPCRCGNFLNNNKQCVCHSLVRSKNLDTLSGELISALDFNINFFESSSKSGLIISDFFYTTIMDNLEDLDGFNTKGLDSISISSYLKTYIEDLYTTFQLTPDLIKSIVRFACILAFLRGRDELLFSDIFDVINLQSNWYKYAKNSKFIQHRPLA